MAGMEIGTENILIQFVSWMKLKVKLHVFNNGLSYKQRDIWWANVGLNIGSEQNGKNDNFERPVLVLRKFGQNIFWGIPLTSNIKEHIYNHRIKYKAYCKNEMGELCEEEKSGVVILNQLKTMSNKRLIRKIGVISEGEFEIVRERIKELV